MNIRRAEEKDIPRLIDLLQQVLEIHADIRPDIFISGTTKYTKAELSQMIKDDNKPVFVAVNEKDVCIGYSFCQIKEQPVSNNMVSFKSIFIDDLCVDEDTRGMHIGTKLYNHVIDFARKSGCYNVTLNVWAGNDGAMKFYERIGFKVQKIGMETII